MTITTAFTQNLVDCSELALAGGKAANLGRLLRAGFSVPGGFVITTEAYRLAQAHGQPLEGALPSDIAVEILAAYRAMGAGSVAVRSSATAEDMAHASMAGQYDTFLDIEGEAKLLDTVRQCWAGLHAARLHAYFQQHGIDASTVGMAVVVQRLVSSDVAGVLFTANPQNGRRSEMLIEASWGLGESVVSGRVQPDVIRVAAGTGEVLAATIADKQVYLAAGAGGEQEVEEKRRKQPCLNDRDIHRLWELGQRAAEYFGAPQDIEWAIHADEVYLLQSRPITTFHDTETQENILQAARDHLRHAAGTGQGPWALHNLAETLPHPTPLTWSVIQRFMSGNGGFGAMYRQAGFEPSAAVAETGFLELIAGRIYMDAARTPEMFFASFPFAYDSEELKRSPDASQLPPTLPRGPLRARLQAARRLNTVNAKLHALSADLDHQLRDQLFPAITQYVADVRQTNLAALAVPQLIEHFQQHERQVLQVFAPQLLMPTLISGMAMSDLTTFLAEHFWQEDPDALAQLISSGGPANRTLLADAQLYEVGQGKRSLEEWLADHGHRAPGEFDLAAPRWRERPAAAQEMAARLAAGDDPLARHHAHQRAVEARVDMLRGCLSKAHRQELDCHIDLVRRYIIFREDGKDVLMLGYDLLRDVALEAARRLEIGVEVFFLARDELFQALRTGAAPRQQMAQRKIEYEAEEKIELPRFLDRAALDHLGNPPSSSSSDIPECADGFTAFPVSAGEAVGPARILRSPIDAGDLGQRYILICPSTDPSWTPLFVNAAGLILERGGALSHGAVVAREMGLPAVVLPNATHLFQENELVRVDGSRGWISRGAEAPAPLTSAPLKIDPDDTRISRDLIPPPPGPKDRRAGKIRNLFALVWAIYLLAFFLLRADAVRQPTLSAMDWLLWPAVRSLGRPAIVTLIAVITALATLFLQLFFTDNHRLLEAKRRAAVLTDQADELPKDSRRRAALLRRAAPVPTRALLASLVPVGILLGPLCMPFVWFQERMEPAMWNAAPGSAVRIVAAVDADFPDPIQISVPTFAEVDSTTPAARTLPPIRRTLEHLLTLYRQPQNRAADPWELKIAPDLAPAQSADDLQAYLATGIPSQSLTWLIRPPEDFTGSFPVTVTAANHPPVTAFIVLGDQDPPTPRIIPAPAGSPIRQLRIVYPAPNVAQTFWRPFSGLKPSFPFAARLTMFDLGWLWLYILVYLPVLMLARLLLRVA